MSWLDRIEQQQKGRENTAAWMVGEQLKDICRREPLAGELVEKDLAIKEMSLDNCEKKIKAWADKHKKGSCAVVPPNVAEKIIREFYGIPEAGSGPSQSAVPTAPPDAGGAKDAGGSKSAEIIDFTEFL